MSTNDQTLAVPDARSTALDMALAGRVADTLMRYYPNHLWAVEIRAGDVIVRNINLAGNMGFVIKTRDIFSASDLDKKLNRAGGELLERYRLTREKSSAERIADKVLALNTDFAGRTLFDRD